MKVSVGSVKAELAEIGSESESVRVPQRGSSGMRKDVSSLSGSSKFEYKLMVLPSTVISMTEPIKKKTRKK